MTENEYRDNLRRRAAEKYERALRWAEHDYREALRFADEATIYLDKIGTGAPEAILRDEGGWCTYEIQPKWVSA